MFDAEISAPIQSCVSGFASALGVFFYAALDL